MKFDKFMNICYRIICIITGIVVIVGLCVSCFGSPLKAKAFSPADPTAWATLVDEWRDEYETNLTTALHEINQGLADGDIDSSTAAGRQYLEVMALQAFALNNPEMTTILHAVDLGLQTVPDFSAIENLPDSVTVSGGGASGVYRSEKDGKLHALLSNSGRGSNSMYYSDEFSLTWKVTNISDSYSTNNLRSGSSERYDYNYYYIPTSSHTITFPDSSYFTNPYIQTWNWSNSSYVVTSVSLIMGDQNTSIPTISQSLNWSNYVSKTSGLIISGNCTSVTLPSESVDTSSPWNYYNNTILPYIHQNYPSITNNYLVFPDGYYPVPTPDPTEPPTFPNGGIYIDKQYNIGINIIYPTDASGQPITDSSGETVTETQYITDTSPLDGEYSFQMPTLAKLNMYDASLPNPDISAYSDGISWIWNACYNILTESGFMPVVMIVFGLALFGFILWKLGG